MRVNSGATKTVCNFPSYSGTNIATASSVTDGVVTCSSPADSNGSEVAHIAVTINGVGVPALLPAL